MVNIATTNKEGTVDQWERRTAPLWPIRAPHCDPIDKHQGSSGRQGPWPLALAFSDLHCGLDTLFYLWWESPVKNGFELSFFFLNKFRKLLIDHSRWGRDATQNHSKQTKLLNDGSASLFRCRQQHLCSIFCAFLTRGMKTRVDNFRVAAKFAQVSQCRELSSEWCQANAEWQCLPG